ncbi:MAG: hypothetical protein ACE5Z5_08030 [Candidatus Bathyarchaeia archaeon]
MGEREDPPEVVVEFTYEKFVELLGNPFFWIIMGIIGFIAIILAVARRRYY